jgi:hypothetical protein
MIPILPFHSNPLSQNRAGLQWLLSFELYQHPAPTFQRQHQHSQTHHCHLVLRFPTFSPKTGYSTRLLALKSSSCIAQILSKRRQMYLVIRMLLFQVVGQNRTTKMGSSPVRLLPPPCESMLKLPLAMRHTWEEIGIDLAEEDYMTIGQLDDREITTSLGKRLLMILSPFGEFLLSYPGLLCIAALRADGAQYFCRLHHVLVPSIRSLIQHCTGSRLHLSYRRLLSLSLILSPNRSLPGLLSTLTPPLVSLLAIQLP